MKKEGLHKFGYTFQIKVITCLLTDNSFLKRILDILSPKQFESEANQWIVETILDYFKEYSVPPTMEALKVRLENAKLTELLSKTIVDHLRDVWKYTESSDLESTKNDALEFCKNQHFKAEFVESIPLIEVGEYEQVRQKIEQASKAGMDTDIGLEYLDAFDRRYEETSRNPIPTPWEEINDITEGGFGTGELVVAVGSAGGGKSWLLVNIGSYAYKKGMTVAHYTLELSEDYVGLRYDSVNTGIDAKNLKYHKDEVKEMLDKMKGELVVKFWPTKSASLTTVKSHMDRMILMGKKPDIVIVDYADLLRGANRKEIRHQLDTIYEDLRGLAGEYQIPVFTASQANRSAAKEEIIQGDNIAESYGKLMIADFVFSISRKVEDKLAGTGRVHIIKNRFGPDGQTFPSKLNLRNGQVQIFKAESVEGKEVANDMKNGESLAKTVLRDKFKDLMG